ncbi:MAG: hypothetical protein SFX18_19155 [Pirellulales bacterium]|nr:hypothetical protein [Pirellulales bacterium]
MEFSVAMLCPSFHCPDFHTLRQLILTTLCEHEQFEPDAFPLTAQSLIRQGKVCGLFFCLHGPRSVRITAIWESAANVVYCYGANGERFATLQLASTPVVSSLPQAA